MHLNIKWLLLTAVALTSCSQDNEDDLTPPTTCDTNPANIKYATTINSILAANGCYGCHAGTASSGSGIGLDTYAGVKAKVDDGRLVGAIAHAQGFSPMPKNGGKMSDCDINKIKAWINAGAQNN